MTDPTEETEMTRTLNTDHMRTWLSDLESGRYVQCRGLNTRIVDGQAEHCAEGVASAGAERDGCVELVFDECGQPRYFSPVDRDTPYGVVEAVSDWLGFDLLNERLDLLRLPRAIHDRIRASRGYEDNVTARKVWVLNDDGASFADIAAAVRCHVGLDLELVPGTVEHAAAAVDSSWRGELVGAA